MSKTTKKPTTTEEVTTPTLRPLSEVMVMSFYQESVNNPSLKNIGGDIWEFCVIEMTQIVDGEKMVNVDLCRGKIALMKTQGFRPPSTSGKGGEKNFSPLMKETKTGITTLLGKNEFTGKDGNSYSFHSFVREYVWVHDGKDVRRKMLTTLNHGDQYKRGNGDEEIMLKKDKNGKTKSFKLSVTFPDDSEEVREISSMSDYTSLLKDYRKMKDEVEKKETKKKKK